MAMYSFNEHAAVKHLLMNGYEIVTCGWSRPEGATSTFPIVARDGDTLVFAAVGDYGDEGLEDERLRRRREVIAMAFLSVSDACEHVDYSPLRFDVIEVKPITGSTKAAFVRHRVDW